MSKKTIRKIVLILAAMLTAGSVAAAAGTQYSDSLLQNADAEKLLYCETDYEIIDVKHS